MNALVAAWRKMTQSNPCPNEGCRKDRIAVLDGDDVLKLCPNCDWRDLTAHQEQIAAATLTALRGGGNGGGHTGGRAYPPGFGSPR